jgi:two-component system, cell cycle sensor histidine kinase PleC
MTDLSSHDAAILRSIAEAIARGLSPAHVNGQAHEASEAQITPAAQHLAKLAHELKTPLSAIVAAAEVMRDERLGPLGERYRGYASGIHESASHALGVINAMLGAETVRDHTTDPVRMRRLDLNQIAGATASSARALLEAAGLSLALAFSSALPGIDADEHAVRQLILNLVTNAMRATPAGGVITVSTATDAAGAVLLTVADTGNGMGAADIERALDGDRSSDFVVRPSGGLGLGYPLILELAKDNHARVSIESEAGVGTRVTISFPPGLGTARQ